MNYFGNLLLVHLQLSQYIICCVLIIVKLIWIFIKVQIYVFFKNDHNFKSYQNTFIIWKFNIMKYILNF
jgi:hypothetical protein